MSGAYTPGEMEKPATLLTLRRKNAEDRVRLAVEHERATNDGGIARELALPERVAHDDHVGIVFGARFRAVKARPRETGKPVTSKKFAVTSIGMTDVTASPLRQLSSFSTE